MPKIPRSNWKASILNQGLASFLPYFLLVFLVLLVLLPIAPHLQVAPSTDSSVFLYIGDRVLKGAVPYRDVWDHKGPLIYYIDALGLALGGGARWGVWFLELIAVGVAACIAYALFKRIFGSWPAIFAATLFVLELRLVLDKGNLVEEYALPLQFLLLWFFLLATTKANWKYYFSLGLVAGFCLLLRPNSLGIQFAIVVYIIAQAVRDKQRVSWKPLVFSGAGGLVVVALAVSYFLFVRAFPSLWDQVITFNLAYSA